MGQETNPSFSKSFRSRRAVSTVITNLILIAAVIAVGFAALGWTYSTSNSYVAQYGTSVQSKNDQLAESLAFEYTYYNGTAKNLLVYLLNCGKIGGVTVTAAYLSNATWTSNILTIKLLFLNGTSSNGLSIGQEGYFVWSALVLQSGVSYALKIVTGRGSNFVHTVAT